MIPAHRRPRDKYRRQILGTYRPPPTDGGQMSTDVERERDALRAELARVTTERDNWRAARRIAADSVDRFRDVLTDALGFPENPGDDELIAEVRRRFHRTGPEPTRWRDMVAGYEAVLFPDSAAVAQPPAGDVSMNATSGHGDGTASDG